MPSEMSNPPNPPASAASAATGRSSSTKRRRTSEHSSLAVPDQPDPNNARSSPTPRVLTRGSPQRGSSREMTPPESSGSIKYTRTGRVSKATKGQRVHHCDECGKVCRIYSLCTCNVFLPFLRSLFSLFSARPSHLRSRRDLMKRLRPFDHELTRSYRPTHVLSI